jgi:NADPH-dependent 2,4-dienoyl-CoA reductase/sulfur reductase-like enzyme
VTLGRRRFLALAGAALAAGPRALRAQTATGSLDLARSPRGRRLVVLGASFGGIGAGLAVRRQVPDAEIILLERSPLFVFAPAALRYAFGQTSFDRIARPYAALGRGLDVVHATVTALDRDRREVVTTGGRVAYDCLLIATGLRLATEEIPGLPDAPGVNLCPYAMDASLLELRRGIASFAGGHVVIGTPEGPYKCPPAPYEYALHWARHLKARRLRGRVTLVDSRSRPTPLALAPGLLQAMAAHKDVLTYEPFTRVLSVDPAARAVETEVGRLRYDFLSLVPPNRAPGFLADAGLGAPYVEVDARSFRTLADERVYAVGDVADTPYARTAYTALSSARIAAQGIARAFGIAGKEAGRPENVCYPQVSATGALRIETTWIDEAGPEGTAHVRATGTVDNHATAESLRRRRVWEAAVMHELFPGS